MQPPEASPHQRPPLRYRLHLVQEPRLRLLQRFSIPNPFNNGINYGLRLRLPPCLVTNYVGYSYATHSTNRFVRSTLAIGSSPNHPGPVAILQHCQPCVSTNASPAQRLRRRGPGRQSVLDPDSHANFAPQVWPRYKQVVETGAFVARQRVHLPHVFAYNVYGPGFNSFSAALQNRCTSSPPRESRSRLTSRSVQLPQPSQSGRSGVNPTSGTSSSSAKGTTYSLRASVPVQPALCLLASSRR